MKEDDVDLMMMMVSILLVRLCNIHMYMERIKINYFLINYASQSATKKGRKRNIQKKKKKDIYTKSLKITHSIISFCTFI